MEINEERLLLSWLCYGSPNLFSVTLHDAITTQIKLHYSIEYMYIVGPIKHARLYLTVTQANSDKFLYLCTELHNRKWM